MKFLICDQWMPALFIAIFVQMITNTTIAIIGNTSLAIMLAKANYRLLLFGGESKDVELMDCPIEASWEADIILLAIPPEEFRGMADKIREVAVQKIVLCTEGLEELQHLLPNSKVIKFTNILLEPGVMDIVGNNGEALHITAELFRSIGFIQHTKQTI